MDTNKTSDSIRKAAAGNTSGCPYCGAENKPGDRFCGICGKEMHPEQKGLKKDFSDNRIFAQGLPDWSLEPPQVVVRRR